MHQKALVNALHQHETWQVGLVGRGHEKILKRHSIKLFFIVDLWPRTSTGIPVRRSFLCSCSIQLHAIVDLAFSADLAARARSLHLMSRALYLR